MRLRSVILLGWFFWSVPIEMLTPGWPVPRAPLLRAAQGDGGSNTSTSVSVTAHTPQRQGGFATLASCERAAQALMGLTRWRIIASECVPD